MPLLLAALFFVFPFQWALPQFGVGIVTMNVFSAGIVLLFGLAVCSWVLNLTRFPAFFHDALIFLFVATFFVSTLLSEEMIRSGRMAYAAIFLPVATYVCLKVFITSEREYRLVVNSMLAGAVLYSLFGLLQMGISTAREDILGIPPIGAATITAWSLAVLIFQGSWRNIAGLFAAPVVGLMLFLTYSRIYLAALALTPLISLFIRKRAAGMIFATFLTVTAAGTAFLVLNPESFAPRHIDIAGQSTLERLTDPELYKQALYGRAVMYEKSFRSFLERPAFGTGLRPVEDLGTVHNFHLEWLEYGGLAAYLLATLMFLAAFATHSGLAARNPRQRAMLVAMLVVFCNSFTNGIMHGVMPYFIFIPLGLADVKSRLALHAASHPATCPEAAPGRIKGHNKEEIPCTSMP